MKNKHAASLGKKGGLAKSPAKTAAVRKNGKKGGRPRKPVDVASAAPCTVRPSAGIEMPTDEEVATHLALVEQWQKETLSPHEKQH